ncbi:MAG: NAD-dependent epimerase/dehydratase family protein [Bacteroidales bacterium]|jgi:UDP-glucuronate 4-epimerase|nr:NAD-dependent epimerase/dehydratase family protein [Bacteroidales bacterium]
MKSGMQNILVTGSAGFIGFHTTLNLLKQGHRVFGIDNLNNYYDPEIKFRRLAKCGIEHDQIRFDQYSKSMLFREYRFRKMDVSEKESVKELIASENFDTIIHLAAQPGARFSVQKPSSYIKTNIEGFFSILEACREHKPKHLIYASSSSIYGNNTDIPYSEDDKSDMPASLYGATKKSNELMAYAYSHLYGIPMTGLRFFTVYGPWGRPDMVYFKYTRAILNNEPIDVYNNGKLRRDFTYIDDIVKGLIDVMKIIPGGDVPHNIFNIGNSSPEELLYFIEVLENILGRKAIRNMLPMQAGDVIETFADTSKLEKYCGYKPHTQLAEGLQRFVDWYLHEYRES